MEVSQLTLNTKQDRAKPLVSVIIANYNYARFLPQAIESVLNQTYQNFELIVVDDGSTDNSRDVIQSYQERVIAIFQENAGQGAAFNTGIVRSQGEILCFLDADDYFQKDKLEKVVNAFQEHPEWVQISHGRIATNPEGVPINQGSGKYNRGDVRKFLLKYGRYALGITSSLSYRRSALDPVLPIPTKRVQIEGKYYTEGADTYLTVTMPFFGMVGSIDEPLMFYRIHGSNVRAHSDNLPYLLKQHKDIATYINEAAVKSGLVERFNIDRDVDYRSLKALEQGGVSWIEVLQIIWLSLRESIALRRSFKDGLERLLRRSMCAILPTEGKNFLRMGFRGYVHFQMSKLF